MPDTLVERPRSKYFSTHLTATPSPLQRKGRPKISDPRQVGAQVRHAIMQVFNGLGSWEGMMAWAKDNPDLFYGSVLPKLLPRDQDIRGIGNITVIVQRNHIGNTPITLEADASMQLAQADPQAAPDLRSESTNNCQ